MRDLHTFRSFDPDEGDSRELRVSIFAIWKLKCKRFWLRALNAVKAQLIEEARRAIRLKREERSLGLERLWSPDLDFERPALTSGALEPQISSDEVDELVTKGIVFCASGPSDEAETRFLRWEQEMHYRLPPYVAEEVTRRVREKLGHLE